MEKMNRFWIATLLVLISVWPALALAPSAPSSLLTAPTHWDQRAVWDQQGDRVIDSRDGRIQCVAMMSEGPYPGAPEEAARAFLAAHADWLKFTATKDNLRVARIMESPMGYHVTFVRVVNGVPVYPGDMVITLDREKIVRFYFSSLYLVPDNTSTLAALGPSEAIRAAYDYLKPTGQPRDPAQTDLVIWAGDNRDFAACWRVRQFMEDPMGDWEVLVDAQSGTIRRVADRACSVDGQGYVHDPDPLTSAGANYGDTGFTDNNDANSTQLQAQRVWVTLRDITYSGGVYSLQGPWVTLLDWEAPWGAPVTSATANGFGFTRDAQGFEDVMVYYQIDKSQRWMQSLGFYNIQYGAIACDPHGFNGADNSHYIPGTNRIAYGEGGVDDAEDADVILHEYGHAITNSIVPGWGGGDEPSMGEGFGDYWAASYSRSLYAFHSDWVYNWDGHNPFWGGRVVNNNYHYPEDMNGDIYHEGSIWSQACYETMLDVGRSAADGDVLQAMFLIGTGASMPTAARAVTTADQTRNIGGNLWAIADRFVARGLLSRPGNDVCPGYSITSLPYSRTDSTDTANNDYTHCIYGTSGDVVYSMTLSSCRTVTASLCGSGFDTGIEVRAGGACPGTTLVACNDDADCGSGLVLQSKVTFVAQAYVTYYILVFGFGTYAGTYTLNVTGTAYTAPNDACPGTLISSLPYTDTGNTYCATNNWDVDCVYGDANDVFYRYTPAACQTVTVSLCGSGYDTGLEVRAGGSCPGTTQIACNDDFCGLQSQVTFTAIGGVEYFIIVDGYSTNAGPYTINVTGTAFTSPGDVCPGTTISSLPYSGSGDTRCAANNWDVNCVYGDSPDVFYNLTLASCQTVTVSLCGSGYDTGLEVRTGGSCPGTTQVACDDDADCGSGIVLQSKVTFLALANLTYYIVVDGFNGYAGPYVINVTGTSYVEENDVCPGNAITSLPYTDSGDTRCAGNDYPNCIYGDSRDVVYSMTLPACYTVTASLCGSGYDTGIEVRAGGSCPGNTSVGCDDDGCGYPYSQLSFFAQANVTYYIIVDGFDVEAGPFTLNVTGTPFTSPNDVCPGTTIPSLPYTDTGNTACANNNYTISCVSNTAPDVVYNMTLTSCQTVTVSLCNSGYDTGLEVRTGGTCPGSTVVACDDDGCGYPYSQLSFVAVAGVTYYIIVDGFMSYSGPYSLNVTGTPYFSPGDQCPGISIPSLPYTNTGNTVCATNQHDVDCVWGDAADVFYTLPQFASCQTVTATLCGSSFDTGLEVRTGGVCPGAVQVACNDDNLCSGRWVLQSTLSFVALPFTTYYIVVDGYSTLAGPYILEVTSVAFVPSNDTCPGTAINSLPYTDTGNTICATNNWDVNCVWGDAADVFYSLTLTSCYNVTVSLCGSGYDTGLEVRTGGTCPGTTQVACNDDNYCGSVFTRQSWVSFTASSNVTYFIIVDGYDGDAGPYVINVTGTPCVPPAAPDSLVAQLRRPNINLYWGNVAGATGYNVYRATVPSVPIGPGTYLGSSLTNAYVDLNVVNTAAPMYFYAVTAVNPGSEPPAMLGPGEGALALLDKSAAVPTEVTFIPAYTEYNTVSSLITEKPETKSGNDDQWLADFYRSAETQRSSATVKSSDEARGSASTTLYIPMYPELTSPNTEDPEKLAHYVPAEVQAAYVPVMPASVERVATPADKTAFAREPEVFIAVYLELNTMLPSDPAKQASVKMEAADPMFYIPAYTDANTVSAPDPNKQR